MGDLVAEPHRKPSDLTVLRRLADDGNEEVEARLTHVAMVRGDVKQSESVCVKVSNRWVSYQR